MLSNRALSSPHNSFGRPASQQGLDAGGAPWTPYRGTGGPHTCGVCTAIPQCRCHLQAYIDGPRKPSCSTRAVRRLPERRLGHRALLFPFWIGALPDREVLAHQLYEASTDASVGAQLRASGISQLLAWLNAIMKRPSLQGPDCDRQDWLSGG